MRNGADNRLLATPLSEPPEARSMAYAGTLSERLDTDLLGTLMAALPDWRLDLYGECRYKGCRDRPGPELAALLTAFPGRIVWHGTVSREELASRLDDARVLLLPHRLVGAVRGDSMKLYDYAARGRPIVSTLWVDDLGRRLRLGHTSPRPASSLSKPSGVPRMTNRPTPRCAVGWAEQNSWSSRWDAWARAVFGQ